MFCWVRILQACNGICQNLKPNKTWCLIEFNPTYPVNEYISQSKHRIKFYEKQPFGEVPNGCFFWLAMSYEILKKHRETWAKKKVLQRIYTDWYERIIGNMIPQGPTLEIGGGGGNLKEFYPGLISSDFTFCPWLDVNLDGHHLPFLSNSLANIVVIDVLHHLAKPVNFIKEAQRVLKKDGRLLMLEPCISPVSYLIYNYLHQEDVDFSPDVFSEEMWEEGDLKNPFDGNMAIPTSMFLRQAEKFQKLFPDFTIRQTSCSDYFIYPLSGGFEHPSFIPAFSLPVMRFFERCMNPVGRFFAFRLLIVLENGKSDE